MKYSTARWLAIVLSVIAGISITTFFYLDEKDMMIPILYVTIKPIMMLTLFPGVLILMASVFASVKQEERITKTYFQKAFVLLVTLLIFRIILS